MKHFVSLIAVLFFVTFSFSQEYGWHANSGAEKPRANDKSINLVVPVNTYQLSKVEDHLNTRTNKERIMEPLVVSASYAYLKDGKLIEVAKADYKLPTNAYTRDKQGKVIIGTLNYSELPVGIRQIKVKIWYNSAKKNEHGWNYGWLNQNDPFYSNGAYEMWIDIYTGKKSKVKKG